MLSEAGQKALGEFESRTMEEKNFLALWIDGKHVAGEQMIICMGVTEKGYKKVLGFTQTTTERSEPIKELLRDQQCEVVFGSTGQLPNTRVAQAGSLVEHLRQFLFQ